MKEEGRDGGSELGYDLDLDPDPDPWKILWIRGIKKYFIYERRREISMNRKIWKRRYEKIYNKSNITFVYEWWKCIYTKVDIYRSMRE